MALEEQVLDLIAKETGAERASLRPEQTFEELGSDSLDVVQILLAVEESFGVTFAEEQETPFRTVGGVIAFVKQHASAEVPPASVPPPVEPPISVPSPAPASSTALLDPPPRRPLLGLLLSEFLTEFNCAAWKYLVALLAIRAVQQKFGSSDTGFEALAQTQVTLAFVVFTLPFVFVSLPAGVLADRWSKRSVLVAMKGIELGLLAVGTLLLFLEPAGGWGLLMVLCLMGVQGAIFSPAKFGVLPEILPHRQLSEGNGRLQMVSFAGLIIGIVGGGVLLEAAGSQPWLAGLLLTALSGVGLFGAWMVPHVRPARTQGGLAVTARGAWEAVRADRILYLSILGSAFYWTVASLLGQDVLIYTKTTLRLSEAWSVAPLTVFGIGVAVGSLLAGRLSSSKVEYGLIPLGAAGLGLFTLLLGALAPGLVGTTILMAVLGIASGFVVVPLYAVMQWRAPEERRGAVIALSNALAFAGILAGSLGAEALSQIGFSARGILFGAAVITIAGTIWALWLLPEALLRLVLVLLCHVLYRLRVVGRANVLERGGALLMPNHVTFIDGLFLIASLDRPVRFLVSSLYFDKPLVKPFMKALGAIPIASTDGPLKLLRSLRAAGKYLDDGELVCIFPEGQLTRVGMLMPFQRGFEQILKGRSVPIIPVHLDRVWGSIFSFAGGRYIAKLPERLPYPVMVTYGKPLPVGTTVHQVRQAVLELGAEAWEQRKPDRRPLHHGFIRQARRHPLRMAFADASRPKVPYLSALGGAVALARALRPHWQGQENVGLLLPPSIGGALANLAAGLTGRVSVNLNYTTGPAGLGSAVRQADLRTVLTSRAFVEALSQKGQFQLPEGVTPLWLEDVVSGISLAERMTALLLGCFAPVRLLERACGAQRRLTVDDVATIIFSSGSTGEPKGVMLTHFNIDANVSGVRTVYRLEKDDRLLGILPFFHSFGCLSLWFAANEGLGVVFHPNPLDAVSIGGLVERYRVTMLLATPTFLQMYLRRCTPAQFGSLRIILAGAEKLPERLAQAFEDQFGIRPLEGYGATECAPVIATSTPDFRAAGVFQAGVRRGCVGLPLPGVALRIVDPDTFAPLPPRHSGMLLVKGPNVMRGYLKRDDLTAKVMHNGWYVTGDVAALDDDGFLRITDRLSRFSKIGGEMVPHGRVEEALQHATGAGEQVLVVTAVPDERKGEHLAVLHTLDEAALAALLEKAAAGGLPNLFLPRREHFVKVERLPVLGTGKIDLRAAKQLAVEALAKSTDVDHR
jgi:acyl-[acyl-carrier-protein]-phospholipid O-acyltransferase/long-chain-fatty-acid--[acyl-carrier-protein] ligase